MFLNIIVLAWILLVILGFVGKSPLIIIFSGIYSIFLISPLYVLYSNWLTLALGISVSICLFLIGFTGILKDGETVNI